MKMISDNLFGFWNEEWDLMNWYSENLIDGDNDE